MLLAVFFFSLVTLFFINLLLDVHCLVCVLIPSLKTCADELRKLSWSGVPSSVRATAWQLLCVSVPVAACFCIYLSSTVEGGKGLHLGVERGIFPLSPSPS